MTADPRLDAAARIIADARTRRDRLPVADAARAAHRAGGPTIAELEALITAQRAARAVPVLRRAVGGSS